MLLQSEKTVLTLSNAIALSAGIVNEIAGNEIANTVNGVVMKPAVLRDMIGSQINKNFSSYTAQGVK
jgi:hypothetical protein